MKCRYIFSVSSNLILGAPLRFEHRGWNFFLEDREGRFSRLIVEITGVEFKDVPRVERPLGAGHVQFTIPHDPMLEQVQQEVRAARGALALWGVHGIDTEKPELKWIPETSLEKSTTDIFGFSLTNTDRDKMPAYPAENDLIVRCFISRKEFIPHEIPLEFHRRGVDDIYQGRFIEAIYDFYFVVEYLFGDGKFSSNGVRDAFSRSSSCCEAFAESRKDPGPAITADPALLLQFQEKYQRKTLIEAIDAVISLRGFLHHQSLTRPKKWNPGTPGEFKMDALFLQSISFESVSKLVSEILFQPKEEAEFKRTRVLALRRMT